MGAVNLDNTGSGSAITLSSDGTSLLLDGTAVGGGGGGGALELISANIITSSTNTVEITGITGYIRYLLHVNYVRTVASASAPEMFFGNSSGYASSYMKTTNADGQSSIKQGVSADSGYNVYNIANLTVAHPTLVLMDNVSRSNGNNYLYSRKADSFSENNNTVFSKIKITGAFGFLSGTTITLYGYKDS